MKRNHPKVILVWFHYFDLISFEGAVHTVYNKIKSITVVLQPRLHTGEHEAVISPFLTMSPFLHRPIDDTIRISRRPRGPRPLPVR